MRIRWQDGAINDVIQVRRFIAMESLGRRNSVLVDIPCIIVYRVEGHSQEAT